MCTSSLENLLIQNTVDYLLKILLHFFLKNLYFFAIFSFAQSDMTQSQTWIQTWLKTYLFIPKHIDCIKVIAGPASMLIEDTKVNHSYFESFSVLYSFMICTSKKMLINSILFLLGNPSRFLYILAWSASRRDYITLLLRNLLSSK